jgi:translation initiation factor 5
VEENILIDWGNKPSKKFVSKEINAAILEKAKPLIQWLESESSSEEESDLEVRHFVSFFSKQNFL